MSLRWRLTLTITLAMLAVALGLGVALYLLAAQQARQAFHLELQTLARDYARLALGADAVRLREPPPSPLQARLSGLGVWLVTPGGATHDALGSDAAPPTLPAATMEQLRRGSEGVFDLGDVGVAAYPIFDTKSFQLSYALLVAAQDAAGAEGLTRLRAAVLGWMVAAALIALAVGNGLALWLSRPLRRIAQTAHAVGQGDLSRRIADTGAKDELGALGRDLNAMLERLEGLVGAHRRFTADAAHDLRTPVAVLKTEVEVALRRERDAASYRATLERLLSRIEGLAKLSDDLLMLSRLEAGPERAFEAFLLRDALEETISVTQAQAKTRGLRFELSLPLSLEVEGDAILIARLVANLLGNAAKFSQSAFGLKAMEIGREVELSVWDDGPGVPEGLKHTLFERFAKGAGSSGTGLGLAIAQGIAHSHGATIRLMNAQPGATFSLNLPKPPRADSNARLTQQG
jgi:signal transduction histidine kinase